MYKYLTGLFFALAIVAQLGKGAIESDERKQWSDRATRALLILGAGCYFLGREKKLEEKWKRRMAAVTGTHDFETGEFQARILIYERAVANNLGRSETCKLFELIRHDLNNDAESFAALDTTARTMTAFNEWKEKDKNSEQIAVDYRRSPSRTY